MGFTEENYPWSLEKVATFFLLKAFCFPEWHLRFKYHRAKIYYDSFIINR